MIVKLAWEYPAGIASTFAVKEKKPDGSFATIKTQMNGTAPTDAAPFTFDMPFGEHTLVVTATGSGMESAPSNELTFNLSIPAPTNLHQVL